MTSAPQPVQGMSDLGPPEIFLWQRLEEQARHVFRLYDYREVRTPILEPTALFTRAIGETTDVVQKEMYTFEDRGRRSLTMRPEGTAGVIRYASGLGPEALHPRLYYMGPMFRSERPQAGRKRQFHQAGVEFLSDPCPAADAETIALQQHLFAAWGLKGTTVEVNTRGLPEDMKAVTEGLRKAVEPHLGELCEDCRRRYETNVLRILDCKQEGCGKVAASLPPVTDFMSAASREYLDAVMARLAKLEVAARVNPRLVRGLDYYVHTVWEVRHPGLGAQDALSGGGRYRLAVGDKTVDGVGFAIGLERVVAAVQHDKPDGYDRFARPIAWIVSHGPKALAENLLLAQALRRHNISCALDLEEKSVKAQMRAANRSGAEYAVIRGEQELEKGLFVLKNMKDSSQEELDMAALVQKLILASRAEVVKS